ncbi:MAG: hypothetical protein ACKOPM_14490 [Novosphingobium sp.]
MRLAKLQHGAIGHRGVDLDKHANLLSGTAHIGAGKRPFVKHFYGYNVQFGTEHVSVCDYLFNKMRNICHELA